MKTRIVFITTFLIWGLMLVALFAAGWRDIGIPLGAIGGALLIIGAIGVGLIHRKKLQAASSGILFIVAGLALVLASVFLLFSVTSPVETSPIRDEEAQPVADHPPEMDSIQIEQPQQKPAIHYKKDEICDLNIAELKHLGRRELLESLPGVTESPVALNLRKLGTDRFRISGRVNREVSEKLDAPGLVIETFQRWEEPEGWKPVRFFLRFANDRVPDISEEWLEVTGRLQMVDQWDVWNGSSEPGVVRPPRLNELWLEVEEWKQIEEPKKYWIDRIAHFPPFNPVQVEKE